MVMIAYVDDLALLTTSTKKVLASYPGLPFSFSLSFSSREAARQQHSQIVLRATSACL